MRALTAEGLQRAAQRTTISLQVFLAGPFIDPKCDEPAAGNNVEAARLRYNLFHALEVREEIRPTLGEHEQLQGIYREHFKEYANAAITEMAHVVENCDCVIIIPSSPGSFSELGYFAAHENVCEKMLILLDSRFSNPPSYIHLGPVALAEMYRAEVHSVNYSSFDSCWEIVQIFLDRHRSKKLAQRYTMRRS